MIHFSTAGAIRKRSTSTGMSFSANKWFGMAAITVVTDPELLDEVVASFGVVGAVPLGLSYFVLTRTSMK